MITLLALFAEPAHADPNFRYRLDPFVAVGTGTTASSVAIGDVTGDGRNDVVLGTFDSSNTVSKLFVFPQRANGTLAGGTPYTHDCKGSAIVLVDLDEDGVMDVVVSGTDSTGCVQTFLASGTGTLTLGPVDTTTGEITALTAHDLDEDGHLDVIGTGADGNTGFIEVRYGDGLGALGTATVIASDAPLIDHEVGDFDNDGALDLAAVDNRTPGSVNIYTNDPITVFSTTYRVYPYVGSANANAVGAGDFTGDGLDDVVISGQQMYRHTQQATGGLITTPTLIPSHDSPQSVLVTDVDVDGDEDVLVVYSSARAVGIYLQVNGSLEAEDIYTIPFADGYKTTAVAAADISGDGCPDIAIADQNDGLVTMIGSCFPDSDGDGTFDDDDKCPFAPDDGTDTDADDVPDACDVCVDDADPAQADADDDGVGDLCDICPDTFDPAQLDRDGDGHSDVCDVCPAVADPAQADADDDGRGDLCDICPDVLDDNSDSDGDGLGDACETCPGVSDDGTDSDGDGLGDTCDCAPDDATRPTVTGACEPALPPATVKCGCSATPSGGSALAGLAALALLVGSRRRAAR